MFTRSNALVPAGLFMVAAFFGWSCGAAVAEETKPAPVTESNFPGVWKGTYNNFCYNGGQDQELQLNVGANVPLKGTFSTPSNAWQTSILLESDGIKMGSDFGRRTWQQAESNVMKFRIQTSYTYDDKRLGRNCQVRAWLQK